MLPEEVGLRRSIMQHADAGIYHERAWSCLQKANFERDKGRRAILATAAFTWRTIARDIEDAAVREIQHATQLVDEAHDGWLRVELAIAQVSELATTFETIAQQEPRSARSRGPRTLDPRIGAAGS
jgi:hypothetical protein